MRGRDRAPVTPVQGQKIKKRRKLLCHQKRQAWLQVVQSAWTRTLWWGVSTALSSSNVTPSTTARGTRWSRRSAARRIIHSAMCQGDQASPPCGPSLHIFCDLKQSVRRYVLCEKIFIFVVLSENYKFHRCVLLLWPRVEGVSRVTSGWCGLAQITRNTPIMHINLYICHTLCLKSHSAHQKFTYVALKTLGFAWIVYIYGEEHDANRKLRMLNSTCDMNEIRWTGGG